MEKLQAALEKARSKRDLAPPPPASGATPAEAAAPTPATPPADPCQAAWEALAPFTIKRRQLERHRVVTSEAGSKAMPFDILRTKVLLQMRKNNWTRLAITSPMPASGKTTTACNLALALSRQADLRSMLLDTDLRDPSVHKFFNTRPEHSIGEVFAGTADFADQALRIGHNVAISMAQKPEADPTRLLLADETVETIDMVQHRYQPDVMIFDLPSLMVNDDTRAFLKNVDCALVVVRANVTRYDQFDTTEREISEHTNVLGVVINAFGQADRYRSAD